MPGIFGLVINSTDYPVIMVGFDVTDDPDLGTGTYQIAVTANPNSQTPLVQPGFLERLYPAVKAGLETISTVGNITMTLYNEVAADVTP